MSLAIRSTLVAALYLFVASTASAQDWYKMPGTQPAGSRRAATRPTTLTNDSILTFVEAELSDETIVRRIKSSQCDFDVSADAIAGLKLQGVSKVVLEAMINVSIPPAIPNRTGSTPGQGALNSEAVTEPSAGSPATVRDTYIPANSTVYIDEMADGFHHYLMAAMRKKSVPLIVVADPNQADFIIFGTSETKRAGWAKMFFLGSGRSGEMASISMVNRRTKVVVFADSSHRYNATRGRRSTAEKLAKYLGKKIKEDQKKLRS